MRHFSLKKSLLFILFFIFLAIFFTSIPILCILLILKPKIPDYSLQTVNVESYELDVVRSQNLIVSSVFSLNLKADNYPNKIGLSFDASRFHVLSRGLVVGMIRIPQFHQPPSSKNVSIRTQVLFEHVNVSEFMHSSSSSREDHVLFDVRILGDIAAQVRVFDGTLPKIMVDLDCDIIADMSDFSIDDEVYSVMTWAHSQMISFPFSSQKVSKKCSMAVLI